MSSNTGSSKSGHDPIARMLNSRLGVLLGVNVRADVYATNAFGILGVPASVSEQELDAAQVRFRNRFRVDRDSAMRTSTLPRYGNGQLGGDPLYHLGSLRNPRQRLVWELFWPHLSDDVFAHFTKAGLQLDKAALRLLEKTAKKQPGVHGARFDHALAVAHHNLAIAREFEVLGGKRRTDLRLWSRSLASWSRVLDNDRFWNHMGGRIESWDDHRLTASDLQEVRSELPRLILGFQRLFCDAHLARGDDDACRAHLQILQTVALPGCQLRPGTKSSVRSGMRWWLQNSAPWWMTHVLGCPPVRGVWHGRDSSGRCPRCCR